MVSFALACALVLAACVPEGGDAFTPTAGERADCSTQGGTLIETGTSPWRCVLDTPDAGQTCTRATDCAGACIASDGGGGICGRLGEPVGCVDLLDETGQRATFCID